MSVLIAGVSENLFTIGVVAPVVYVVNVALAVVSDLATVAVVYVVAVVAVVVVVDVVPVATSVAVVPVAVAFATAAARSAAICTSVRLTMFILKLAFCFYSKKRRGSVWE